MPRPTTLSLDERRARKKARREKQHQENLLRAEKMHRARLTDPLNGAANPFIARTYSVGCSGWFYWHWKGQFYPASLPTNQWFTHYRKHFDTVELNAPFYGWPTVATVKSWRKQVEGTDFLYTVKVNELITHSKRFKGTKRLVKDFGYIADLLGPHMGCFLFQLPPSFHYTPARLKAMITQLDPARRNAVEFRHASWWNEDVYKAFRAHGIIFCSASGPRLPDVLVKTADEVYVRMHGTKRWYRHNYSDAELELWAQRITASKATRSWVYFNNDRDGYAITNAQQLLGMLETPKKRRSA